MRVQVFTLCSLLLGCGESATADSEGAASETTASSETGASPEASPSPSTPERAGSPEVAKVGVPAQVTVLPEDEWDRENAGTLQIPVSERHSAYVLAGAQTLLAAKTLADDKGTAIQLAQGLLLDIARADLVVIAEAVEETRPMGTPAKSTVTFVTKTVIKGRGPEQWTLDFLADPGSCGTRPPKLNGEALFFLRLTEDGPSLAKSYAIRSIYDGKIAGFPGLAPEAADLKAAHAAGVKEMQP